MKHTFTDYQRQAFAYAKSRERIALFMEMRLGKSSVVIRWAKHRQAKRVLLVAPLTTLLGELNWQGELRREDITPTVLSSIPKDRRMSAIRPRTLVRVPMIIPVWRTKTQWAHGWFAVNYEALRTQPEILDAPWDAIILDESTRIRSPRAQITKTLLSRVDHIPYRAILTGLPNPEDPIDYFCQLMFLHGHFMRFDNFWAFRQSLFYLGYSNWDWRPKKGTRDKIKEYVHQHAFVLTRKQAKVGSTKIRKQRSVELNAAQRRALKEIRTTFEVSGVETKWVTVQQTWMQRIAGGFHPVTKDLISDAKIRLAEDLLVNDFRREPVVMWFRFNNEIAYLQRWLRKRHPKLRVESVTGAITPQERPRIQQRFQSGTTQVLLMQVKLGRFGWNLSHSSTAIYFSNTYEFEDRSQSEDRIIHLKKREDCLYVDLVTLGTPDEDVVASLSEKRLTARLFNTRLRAASRMRFLSPGERL